MNEDFVANADSPEAVSWTTQDTADPAGDAADQAERLTMVMEAEATRNALRGTDSQFSGEGSLDGLDRPLADTEGILSEEDAEDASDDPMHAGGLSGKPWMPAEQAAMHITDGGWLDDETDAQRANPEFDQYSEPEEHLTPEDETLLGIDPYEDRE